MLGRQFLTAAYLIVNQDTRTFALWQANPAANSRLIAIKDASCSSPSATANSTEGAGSGATNGTTSGTAGSSETSSAGGDSGQTHNSTVSPTDIAAFAASGSVFVALIIAALLFWRKSKKSKKELEDSKRMSFFDRGLVGNSNEVHGDSATQETESEDVKYEMWAHEENMYEMSAPAASWTPLGQERQHDFPMDGAVNWPLDRKMPLVAELPAS
jgi:hypothetical protein